MLYISHPLRLSCILVYIVPTSLWPFQEAQLWFGKAALQTPPPPLLLHDSLSGQKRQHTQHDLYRRQQVVFTVSQL